MGYHSSSQLYSTLSLAIPTSSSIKASSVVVPRSATTRLKTSALEFRLEVSADNIHESKVSSPLWPNRLLIIIRFEPERLDITSHLFLWRWALEADAPFELNWEAFAEQKLMQLSSILGCTSRHKPPQLAIATSDTTQAFAYLKFWSKNSPFPEFLQQLRSKTSQPNNVKNGVKILNHRFLKHPRREGVSELTKLTSDPQGHKTWNKTLKFSIRRLWELHQNPTRKFRWNISAINSFVFVLFSVDNHSPCNWGW